jgi:hypothetical protein
LSAQATVGTQPLRHPLLYLAATRPAWLAEHARAYGELLVDETGTAAGVWLRQALLLVAALGCSVATLAVAGVAVLLWGVTPAAQQPAPWVWAVALALPLVPGLLCVVLAWRATGAGRAAGHFAGVRAQLRADLAMLHGSGDR